MCSHNCGVWFPLSGDDDERLDLKDGDFEFDFAKGETEGELKGKGIKQIKLY